MDNETVDNQNMPGEQVQRQAGEGEEAQSKAVGKPLESEMYTERGQTTAEYALVLLAAGTIAMLVVAWAQGNGLIGGLFDAVIEKVTGLME